jgi:hypothetical protein
VPAAHGAGERGPLLEDLAVRVHLEHAPVRAGRGPELDAQLGDSELPRLTAEAERVSLPIGWDVEALPGHQATVPPLARALTWA